MPTSSEQEKLDLLSLIESNNPQDHLAISNLLSRDPTLARTTFRDTDNRCINSILYYAAQSGNIRACEMLLDNNAMVLSGSKPAIFGAIDSGNSEIVHLMIKKDATCVNARPHKLGFNSPLHVAAQVGSAEICKLLIQNGALHYLNQEGKSPIDYASSEIREVFNVINEEEEIQQQDDLEETPLIATEEERSASPILAPQSSRTLFGSFKGASK